jgi:thioredoxin reductase (NADPH)
MDTADVGADTLDCLIIGGGPAGLTAAIYLARFHLAVTVIDAGHSRARLIPLTRNHAGFPEGIAGIALLARMRKQAEIYGVRITENTVEVLSQHENDFAACLIGSANVRAQTVLLATGVVNRRPPMIDDRTHALALAGGQLRYCPVCDGYEVTDRRVAVMGTGQRGCEEALFIRSYTSDVSLISPGRTHELSIQQRASLTEAGISITAGCSDIRLEGDKIVLEGEDGPEIFDSLYPALGTDIRSELARQVGADLSDEGALTVDAHQRTSVAGLYAAGDVVLGLDQISHAMGQGGVAATTIRNDLARRKQLHR